MTVLFLQFICLLQQLSHLFTEKKNLVFQEQDRKCEVQGNTKPFVAARSYTSKPNAVLYWQYRLSQGQLKCYSFCTVTLIPRDISRSSTLGAERQIYLQLGLKNNIKTVGVGSGCQGWKVADPYCWWSVEEANIQPDHAQTLASRGQRETICEENAHTRTHAALRTAVFTCTPSSSCVNYTHVPQRAGPVCQRGAVDRRLVKWFQTPACVCDYSSAVWFLGWAAETRHASPNVRVLICDQFWNDSKRPQMLTLKKFFKNKNRRIEICRGINITMVLTVDRVISGVSRGANGWSFCLECRCSRLTLVSVQKKDFLDLGWGKLFTTKEHQCEWLFVTNHVRV